MEGLTLNEGLEMVALLKERISDLNELRKENTVRESWKSGKDVVEVKEPMYDVKKVDKLIQRLSKDLRILSSAIKKTNATAVVSGYESKSQEDFDLGELEDFDIEKK